MDEKVLESGRKFAARVRETLNPYKIMMYGSQVYGKPTEDSDIDIAVIFDELKDDYRKATMDLWGIAWETDNIIEPIILELKYDRSGFAEEIMRMGIEL